VGDIRERPVGPKAGGRVLEDVSSKAPSPQQRVWGAVSSIAHRGPATNRFSAFLMCSDPALLLHELDIRLTTC